MHDTSMFNSSSFFIVATMFSSKNGLALYELISLPSPLSSIPSNPISFAIAYISSHDQSGQPNVENAIFINHLIIS